MRLGYACINLSLEGGFRSCILKTVNEMGIDHVKEITLHNFMRLYKIIDWNIKNNIKLYRLSSELIPFGSHPVLKNWKWWDEPLLARLGGAIRGLVRDHDLRLSVHPGQFNILSSPRADVVNNTFRDLHYQTNLMHFFGATDMIIHVGGRYEGKKESIERFKTHFKMLPEKTSNYLRIENDDKIYTIADVFELCSDLGTKPIFDFHHDLCAPSISTYVIKEELPKFWGDSRIKTHLSTGDSHRFDRKHANFISKATWEEFCGYFGDSDIDVMLETKLKDLSVLRVRDYESGAVKF